MEAIEYFERVRNSLKGSDHMTAAALDDRLVRLYTRIGDTEKAQKIHDDYVYHMQKYLMQKEDETLQEMESSYDVQEKDRQLERNRYQMIMMVLLILMASAVIILISVHVVRVRRRAAEYKRVSNSKEQIIEMLFKELKSPDVSLTDEIAKLAEALGTTPAMILGWQPSNVDYMITDKNGNQIMVESMDPPSSQELFVTTNYKNLSIDSKSRLYEFLKKLMELDKLEGGDPK
jgi:Flp pilus assembly secretin CpaC